jgi:uncharacterized protein (TIGR01777 family)
VLGTGTIAEAMKSAPPRPRTLVSASAIGIYGDRGDEVLSDTAPPGTGFLAEVGRAWEAATDPARDAGVRTVLTRFGIVLSPADGALAKLLLPFRLGLGGPFGTGRQWMSWIGIDDLAGALDHVLLTPSLEGPMNLFAPEPVRNADFARTLGRVLDRPALLPLPAVALRAALGELADESLLGGARVVPDRLIASGYRFRQGTLEPALRHLLGRQGTA